jgi:hypothetical protein
MVAAKSPSTNYLNRISQGGTTMIRQTIAFVWEYGQSRKGKMPSAHDMEVLVEERRDRIRILLRTTPVAALGATDFGTCWSWT